MQKLKVMTISALVGLIAATAAHAEPASKFSAMVKGPMIIPATSNDFDWKPVLSTTMKVASQKDLLIGVSFETGIFTSKQVTGKNKATVTSTAAGDLQVKVLLNSQELAFPKSVTFNRHLQALTAQLGGVLQTCRLPAPVQPPATPVPGTSPAEPAAPAVINVETDCDVSDEMVGLVLDSLSANHFNFVAPNLAAGTYTIEVLVKGRTFVSGQLNTQAPPTIMVGSGSLTVEQVKGSNAADGIAVSSTGI